jgi:hypothetical protein
VFPRVRAWCITIMLVALERKRRESNPQGCYPDSFQDCAGRQSGLRFQAGWMVLHGPYGHVSLASMASGSTNSPTPTRSAGGGTRTPMTMPMYQGFALDQQTLVVALHP